MTQECRFWYYARNPLGPSYGMSEIITRCETHGVEMPHLSSNGEDQLRCSIGKIEDATEDALLKIAEAQKPPT